MNQNKFYVFIKQKGVPRKISDALTFDTREEVLEFLEAYDIDNEHDVYVGVKNTKAVDPELTHKKLYNYLSKQSKKYKFTYSYGNSIKAYKWKSN